MKRHDSEGSSAFTRRMENRTKRNQTKRALVHNIVPNVKYVDDVDQIIDDNENFTDENTLIDGADIQAYPKKKNSA